MKMNKKVCLRNKENKEVLSICKKTYANILDILLSNNDSDAKKELINKQINNIFVLSINSGYNKLCDELNDLYSYFDYLINTANTIADMVLTVDAIDKILKIPKTKSINNQYLNTKW